MIKYLSKEEVKTLFRVIRNPRDLAIFTVAYWRGLRASEVGMLRFSSFDREGNRLQVVRLKNSLGGDYLLNPAEAKVIRAWIRRRGTSSGALFPSNRGKGISRQQLDKLMRKYGAEAGLPVDKRHFHVLKHSIATHLRESGVDILEIKDWLGHRNINSTLQYTHLSDPKRDQLSRKVFAEW